ncbi:ubiquinone biosynthesis protein COQ9-B, mitochondrial-like [Acanthaster planci]|uniref:Ubiquinone biosynthesis protein n=1 Tax=Acanthaster planci TaxID=133434 RepID=A0A8B7XJU1_ACAPL|nr:ubiquinone biosynthesis protein COQ9-B, mitochondrial-like [Acanthaster planci]
MAACRSLRAASRLPFRSLFSPKQTVYIRHTGGQLPGTGCEASLPRVRWCSTANGSQQTFDQTANNHGKFQGAPEPTSEGERQEESEASVKRCILESALDFVPAFGWSTEALAEGARAQGLAGVAHGMFPRGGGELVHHFVRECNAQLAEKLAREVQEETQEEEKEGGRKRRRTIPFIRDALEARLRMIIPFIDQWPQAMAMSALPANTKEHFSNLMQLLDDIWYHAGDRSSDFNWYTKRISLAAVYKTAELCLIQDESTDYQDTWMFINRRLEEFGQMYKMRSDIEQAVTGVASLMTAAFTVGRNMAGLNNRIR